MVHNSYDHRVQQTSIRKVLFLGLVCKVRHLELSGVTPAQYVIELLVSGVAHGTNQNKVSFQNGGETFGKGREELSSEDGEYNVEKSEKSPGKGR